MSIIAQIKDKTDIVELLQREGVQLRKAGNIWKACCPFHIEKTPSFVVYPDEGRWHCYGVCGADGDVLDFYQRQHNVDLKDAIDELAKRAGIERIHSPSSKHIERLYGVLTVAAETYHKLLSKAPAQAARDYLEQRGITTSDIDRWQIGYAPQQGMLKYLRQLGYKPDLLEAAGLIARREDGTWYERFRNRLIFPIRDERGRVVGFGARAINDSQKPKYINSPETLVFHKTDLLYGMHRAKDAIRKQQQAIVVEGYSDVIAAHRAGHDQVVGSMGTALSETQMKQLRYAQRVILALDGDEAGKKAILRGAQYAGALWADVRVAQFPNDMDADDALKQGAWEAAIQAAIPVTTYIIERALATLPDDASLVEKVKLAKRLIPLLMAAESDLLRRPGVQELALCLGLDYHILMSYAQAPPKPPPPTAAPLKTSPTPEMTILATLIAHPDWYDAIEADLIFLDEPLAKTDFGEMSQIFTLLLAAREAGVDAHDHIYAQGSDVLPESDTLDKARLWRQILYLRLKYLIRAIDDALDIRDKAAYQRLHKRKVNVLREFMSGKS